MAVPLGYFLAILKSRVKRIDQTTKDMGTSNVGVNGLDLRPPGEKDRNHEAGDNCAPK